MILNRITGFTVLIALVCFKSAQASPIGTEGKSHTDNLAIDPTHNQSLEPYFCHLKKMQELEFNESDYESSFPKQILQDRERMIEKNGKPKNVGNHLHAFKIGDATLVGVSVGCTHPDLNKQIAIKFAHDKDHVSSAKYKYCTWYLNSVDTSGGDDFESSTIPSEVVEKETQVDFNWFPIDKNPKKVKDEKAYKSLSLSVIDRILKTNILDNGKPNFVACLVDQGYLAIGCNGMNHRGPLVIGSLLTFSGCSTDHTLEILDHYWPVRDGSKRSADELEEKDVRKMILEEAYLLGKSHEEQKKKIQTKLISLHHE